MGIFNRKRRYHPSYQEKFQVGDKVTGNLPVSISKLAQRKRTRLSMGSIVRGVVVGVYEGDASAPKSPVQRGITSKANGILCDVEVYEGEYCTFIPAVPVMTGAFGITDKIQWTPRAATINTKKGTKILLETTKDQRAPSITDSDGDVVVVAFMDNDYAKPVIIGALPCTQTLVAPSEKDTTKYKWEATIRGNRVGIQDGGQVDIDVTGQTNGNLTGSKGEETPVSNPTIVITSKGATITIDDSGVKIEESDGTEVTIDDGVNINVPIGKKTTIGGNSGGLTGPPMGLVRSGGWDDMFGAGGAFWEEALPILFTIGAIIGKPTVKLTALGVAFQIGVDNEFRPVISNSLESE